MNGTKESRENVQQSHDKWFFFIVAVDVVHSPSTTNLQKYEDPNDFFSLSNSVCVRQKIYFAHHKFRWPNHLLDHFGKSQWKYSIAGKKECCCLCVSVCICMHTDFFLLQMMTVFSSANSFRSRSHWFV